MEWLSVLSATLMDEGLNAIAKIQRDFIEEVPTHDEHE